MLLSDYDSAPIDRYEATCQKTYKKLNENLQQNQGKNSIMKEKAVWESSNMEKKEERSANYINREN
jgi:hypothetical protein